jgi:membrane protein DedA with SNARE-associated domain
MLHLLLQYAYPLMIPLSLVEGPIVAMAGGAGAATGQVDPFIAYAIVMGGGLFQDVTFYGLGRLARRSGRVRGWIERLCAVKQVMAPLHAAWRERMFLTLLASKFAYGLYFPIMVSAGLLEAPFWRYLGESILMSAFILAGWEAVGYGLVRAYGELGSAANWATAGLGVFGILGLWLIGRWARRRLQVAPPQPVTNRSA